MKSPREKYQNDPAYRGLVDNLESLIEYAQFSPSELREAVMLACINHEMLRAHGYPYDQRIREAIQALEEWRQTDA